MRYFRSLHNVGRKCTLYQMSWYSSSMQPEDGHCMDFENLLQVLANEGGVRGVGVLSLEETE